MKPTICTGEADAEIRRLCRELVANGDDVIVLSNDASLIVGIPDSVYVANASKLSLVRNNDPASGKRLLVSLETVVINTYAQNDIIW